MTPWLIAGALGVAGVAAVSAGFLVRSGRRPGLNAAS